MKREIKFRAWDGKTMFYNVQELYDGYGNITDREGNKLDIYEIQSPGFSNATDYFGALLKEENIIVMQYTGLLDKNGKEIYENDVIESVENGMRYLVHDIFPLSRFPEYHSSTPISKNTKEFGVMFSNGIREDYSDDWVSNPEFYEILGNVYENPELVDNQTNPQK